MTKRLSVLIVGTVLLIALAVGTLAANASPDFFRTSVRGIWGMTPISYTEYGAQTLVPTGSIYHTAPTATLTLVLSTTQAMADDVLIIVSTVATDTVISSTNAAMPNGAITLATANDSASFMFNGTSWIQMSHIDQLNIVSGGAASFTSLATTGNIVSGGDLTVDDTFNIDDTAYSSVGVQTLDPAASLYLMSPLTTLTLTLATTTSVAGDFVWFMSQVATDTVIIDTTCTAGGGNRTLGTDGDTIGFIYDGAKWCEAFYSDNS